MGHEAIELIKVPAPADVYVLTKITERLHPTDTLKAPELVCQEIVGIFANGVKAVEVMKAAAICTAFDHNVDINAVCRTSSCAHVLDDSLVRSYTTNDKRTRYTWFIRTMTIIH